MKAFIYMALVIVFIVFFQQNPLLAMIIIAIAGGGFLLYKSRKKGVGGVFRSGNGISTRDNTQNLLTYMLLQQLSNNTPNSHQEHRNVNFSDNEMDEHEKARQEILELLE